MGTPPTVARRPSSWSADPPRPRSAPIERPMNYETVLAGLPDAVIAVDGALRIVFWNAAAEVLTGRSARRAQGRLVKERSEEHTSELQSPCNLVCRLLLEKKKK